MLELCTYDYTYMYDYVHCILCTLYMNLEYHLS